MSFSDNQFADLERDRVHEQHDDFVGQMEEMETTDLGLLTNFENDEHAQVWAEAICDQLRDFHDTKRAGKKSGAVQFLR